MKKLIYRYKIIAALSLAPLFLVSCMSDLLDREPTTELGSAQFWQTEADAEYALAGAYFQIRRIFGMEYYWDGMGEYQRTRGVSNTESGNNSLAYAGGSYNPSGNGANFDNYFEHCYGAVHRCNYVIENVRNMLPTASAVSRPNLEAIIGEARFLRGITYFRLITMWGHVPYIYQVVNDNSEVEDLARTPIEQVKDSIMADFAYAIEKLPNKPPVFGRVGKPAALGFRGKLQLYWGSWNKFGWPELEGFQPSATAATAAYTAAAADFKRVIEDFGLNLYRNGEPGEIDALGKAEVLPNYFYLFLPTANGNRDPSNTEVIMPITFGTYQSGQSDQLMRDVGSRSHSFSQMLIHPRYEIVDRYQSTITGDFVEPLKLLPPPAGRTAPGAAINPQSYADRDYRMKSTIMWDYEVSMGLDGREITDWVPFIYLTWNSSINIDGKTYITLNTTANNSGIIYRKFLRNYAGEGRSDGSFAWPVMRLADVFLMYAEATNEVNGPQPDAINLVNRIRYRGNLPPLKPEKYATKEDFFDAIEQERIVELIGEGHRGFDLRRWRAIERVWVPPYTPGVWRRDTHGVDRQRYFNNTSERTYEQAYIYRIPPSERDRNPNLTQNTPFL